MEEEEATGEGGEAEVDAHHLNQVTVIETATISPPPP